MMNRFYSSCSNGVLKPLNQRPIGYLSLPGLIKYDTALALQSALVARRHQITQGTLTTSTPADIICFLQHPPTFTAGRRIRGKTELEEEERLRKLGAEYFETMRGGQITFHGPGQLIAYPILDIRDYQLNVRCYVSRLEKTIIDCCAKYDIKANTTENTGVWVGENDKIAALGVHLQRYVSSHGLALNCNVDLSWFDKIVPCGLSDKQVTSISKETNQLVTATEVIPHLVASFETLFQKQLVPVDIKDVLQEKIRLELDL
ncbi:lipoyl transferase-like protein [Helicostylum pulchrum]|uniref:Octanoyltransferase n=1 Tax=Helicostylum pulchrum TaxID=562976 RepID=A0ABP9XQY7_9FUNG|nr:lipoyl transferase-like protein [Helicostylum pulchrum]